MMAEHTQDVGDEHKKHKMDIKAMVTHFKNYNQTKEELRIKCEDSNTAIEDCCKEIKALEMKFHDEMSQINHEEEASWICCACSFNFINKNTAKHKKFENIWKKCYFYWNQWMFDSFLKLKN